MGVGWVMESFVERWWVSRGSRPRPGKVELSDEEVRGALEAGRRDVSWVEVDAGSSAVFAEAERGFEVKRDEMICFVPAAAAFDDAPPAAAGFEPEALSSYVSSSYSSLSSSNLNFLAEEAEEEGRTEGAAEGVGRGGGLDEEDGGRCEGAGVGVGRGAGFFS